MAVLQISSRQFRDKLKSCLELVDKGEKVVVQRGKKSYVITPMEDDDIDLTPQMYAKIDLAIKQAREGDTFKMLPNESLSDFLARNKNNV